MLNPNDTSNLAELEKIKRQYFYALALSCKLNLRGGTGMNTSTLFDMALSENIEWKNWPEWLSKKITDSEDDSSSVSSRNNNNNNQRSNPTRSSVQSQSTPRSSVQSQSTPRSSAQPQSNVIFSIFNFIF